mmetsp:Transcript_17407/g.29171  ORF Transcript_17407/g.29171 Transcript_17407/m.29171 type:complete len:496 (+) Transcript_17407:153-1640(+)|eukprot:CAMPEP_0114427792 /NCGR_PEP_ID=MMETSP0103-20121206/8560_1 /TAXON_ID=37642 ORGANISM="Paraphysomonas imperforata, Strain PA2" /NCGR_SAMPLE_ID=MMETSP0103 /ASSEMBLY_ACC=CAM_ASM_000201 /LENGTH=495 /DNA_ID=CAMNT_0001596923 /DNA_START=120 /DNA_END=1607 /DNA_ORIENTATION=+
MRETVTIQVGQCGNQIGNQFWSMLLKEHETTPDDDSALSAFFRFAPQRNGQPDIMKARALLVDMECGPLTETMKSPLGSLFDETQFVMDVYGAGNNFAHGNREYGPTYRDKFEEGLRRNAEQCDSLQSFIVTHSLGGGTGSGVGSYMLELLHDLYPEVYRFAVSVYPSVDNDVITSPYNSILASKVLIDHAHCVLPIDNHALQLFAQLEADQRRKEMKNSSITASPDKTRDKDKGFDEMNGVAARMLCHLTASCRFHGDMNVDMNEICTNLVPYPDIPFLMTAMSPYRASSSASSVPNRSTGGRGKLSGHGNKINTNNTHLPSSVPKTMVQRGFTDLLSVHGQISAAVPCDKGSRSTTLAAAFLVRGQIPLADFMSCVSTAQSALRFPSWNPDACKIGMCATTHPGETFSSLGVYNSTAFGNVLAREHGKFMKLFKRKAMLHHYTDFLEEADVDAARECTERLLDTYQRMDRGSWAPQRQFAGTNLSAVKLFPAF